MTLPIAQPHRWRSNLPEPNDWPTRQSSGKLKTAPTVRRHAVSEHRWAKAAPHLTRDTLGPVFMPSIRGRRAYKSRQGRVYARQDQIVIGNPDLDIRSRDTFFSLRDRNSEDTLLRPKTEFETEVSDPLLPDDFALCAPPDSTHTVGKPGAGEKATGPLFPQSHNRNQARKPYLGRNRRLSRRDTRNLSRLTRPSLSSMSSCARLHMESVLNRD